MTRQSPVGKQRAERVREASTKAAGLVTEIQKALNVSVEEFSKRMRSVGAFNQKNLNAFATSSATAARVIEVVGNEIAAYTKTSLEERSAAMREFATANSMTEAFEKQTAFARSAFEGWVHQASRMREYCTAAAEEIAAPIGQRYAAAAEEAKV